MFYFIIEEYKFGWKRDQKEDGGGCGVGSFQYVQGWMSRPLFMYG